MNSAVPPSPEGVQLAKRYVDEATELVASFSKVFAAFLEHHSLMGQTPALRSDSKWLATATTLLAGVNIAALGAAGSGKQLLKDFSPVPEGCFPVDFEIMKIQQNTKTLTDQYDRFLKSGRQSDLATAGQTAQEISKRIENALNALDGVIDQIKSLSA
jgi:hypothetical protein